MYMTKEQRQAAIDFIELLKNEQGEERHFRFLRDDHLLFGWMIPNIKHYHNIVSTSENRMVGEIDRVCDLYFTLVLRLILYFAQALDVKPETAAQLVALRIADNLDNIKKFKVEDFKKDFKRIFFQNRENPN